MLRIEEFDIEIEHVKGKNNIVADMLTRHPLHMPNQREKPGEIIHAMINKRKLDEEVIKMLRNLKKLQGEEDEFKKIKIKMEEEEAKGDEDTRKTYREHDDVIYEKDARGEYRIMIPSRFHELLILAIHEAYGHIGVKKMRKLPEEDFYIKNLRHKVAYLVSTCGVCQRNKPTTHPLKGPLQNILPERPGELLSVDFYGPLPTSTGGVKHIFVTIDAFSKLVTLYPIKRATTAVIIKKMVRNNHTSWACYVSMIQEIINETYHDTTEFTPYELHWNKKPNKMWAK